MSFLASCLWVTLKQRLTALAPGLTPRQALAQLAGVQMLDVVMPTTDGRTLVLSRYTQPEAGVRLLLQQLKLTLPEQSPPGLSAARTLDPSGAGCSEDLSGHAPGKHGLFARPERNTSRVRIKRLVAALSFHPVFGPYQCTCD